VPRNLAPSTISLVLLIVPAALVAAFYCFLISLGRSADGVTTSLLDLIPPFLFSLTVSYIVILANFILMKFLYSLIVKIFRYRRD